jgi:aminoglycoside phosphotransferase (APT) family kinase protein
VTPHRPGDVRPAHTVSGTLDVERVQAWLQGVALVAGSVTARLIAGGRSNPTYELRDDASVWILRRPPYGSSLPTAHDMSREARVLSALWLTPVPVPQVVARCDDLAVLGAPFYVMDRLDGVTLRTPDDTASLDTEDRARLAHSLVRTLADLHSVDPAEIGLESFGRPDGYLLRQLDRWRRQWESSRTRELAEVDLLLERLGHTVPSSTDHGVLHGDYKLDNLMVDRADPARILGVLDWEMSTLGDPLSDVGTLVSFWDEADEEPHPITAGATALRGFPGRAEIAGEYAELHGVDIALLDWYVVLADLKTAIILEGIHARTLQGHVSGDDFDSVGAMVAPLVRRAMERASGSRLRRLRT